jgi:ATP-dependent DNA helicase RecG
MTTQELIELLNFLCSQPQEKTWLEFKSNLSDNQQIGEYISALSNGACIDNEPHGYLVWGVDDSTHVVSGTTFKISGAKQGNQDLELWLRNLLTPSIYFEVYEFEYVDKQITMLRIPAATGEPTSFKTTPYIRINSNKTQLNGHPELTRRIYNSNMDWSAQVVANATVNNLSSDAISLARRKFAKKNPQHINEIEEWDDLTFLDKVKVTIGGMITNTAILLLGKPEASSFLLPAVSQITWKLDAEEQAYEHFSCPFLLNTSKVLQRIRNVRHKIFPDDQLIPVEVMKYEPRVVLEALHNCIAHQDYSLNSRIVVTEKTDKLIFTSSGSFFDGRADDYILGEKTPARYRNSWLANAMVNLNMIDTMGYGIHTMYQEQRKRYFPLPDYSKSQPDKVVLEIYGHVIDPNYSKLLLDNTQLALDIVILLDRVQKGLSLDSRVIRYLKRKGLIEGRKPNIHIAAHVAGVTGDKAQYIKNRSFKDDHYEKLIITFIKKYKEATRQDITTLLWDILPDLLNEKQKDNKIKNLIHAMSKKGSIVNHGTNRKSIWKIG